MIVTQRIYIRLNRCVKINKTIFIKMLIVTF